MPSKSKAQHNLMAMVAHDPKAAKRMGIPQSVGRDYIKADKGRKFGSGGPMKESKEMMKKEISFMKKKGAPKSMIAHEEREHESIGMERKMKGMKKGGMTGPYRKAADGVAIKGKTRGAEIRMASGGAVGGYRRAADGIASKGKTRGAMIKMKMGGSC